MAEKTDVGTKVLPITEDVAEIFRAIIEGRNIPKVEKSIDGYNGFLFYDDNGMPLVAMHTQTNELPVPNHFCQL